MAAKPPTPHAPEVETAKSPLDTLRDKVARAEAGGGAARRDIIQQARAADWAELCQARAPFQANTALSQGGPRGVSVGLRLGGFNGLRRGALIGCGKRSQARRLGAGRLLEPLAP